MGPAAGHPSKTTRVRPLAPARRSPHTKAYPSGVYITHYREMGHVYDTMESCLNIQPDSGLLPLADYVDSAAIFAESAFRRRVALR